MKILQIGFFPPPIHGMSLSNQRVYEFLVEQGLEIYRICSGFVPKSSSQKGLIFLLARLQNFFNVLVTVTHLLNENRQERVIAYVTPSGGIGIFFDWYIYRLLVKLKISTIIYHHHSFAYLTNRSRFIQKIVELSDKSYHVFLCPSMQKAFLEMYGMNLADRTFIIGNAWCIETAQVPNFSTGDKTTEVCLGHLSNLCQEKGLHTVISIFEKLIQKGRLIKLYLAGPASEADAIFIKDLINKYENLVQWSGAVYGLNKQQWYEKVDVFIFPSRYVNEAQPTVILEAMSHGCTAIATQRGCIPEMLVEGSGYVIAESEFEETSVRVIENLIDDRDKLNLLQKNAYSRFKEMQNLAQLEIKQILSILRN